jgi:hypothetical protein
MPDVIATRVNLGYYQPPAPDSPIFNAATPIEGALFRDTPAQEHLTKIIENTRDRLIEEELLTGEELHTRRPQEAAKIAVRRWKDQHPSWPELPPE